LVPLAAFGMFAPRGSIGPPLAAFATVVTIHALAELAFAAIAATVARAPSAPFAVGGWRRFGGGRRALRRGRFGRLGRIGSGIRLATAAVAPAMTFGLAATLIAARATRTPDLDHLGLGWCRFRNSRLGWRSFGEWRRRCI